MLDLLVSWILKDRLKGLLQHFSSSNLDIELRNGVVRLQRLTLAPEAFASLVPASMMVEAATAETLEVLLPWRQSPAGPLVLRLDGVRVVIGMKAPPHSAQDLDKWLHAQKLRRLERAGAVEPSSKRPAPTGPPLSTAQLQSAIDALLRDLQVSVSDVVVVIDGGDGSPAMRFGVRSLQMRCQRERSLPQLLSICSVRPFASIPRGLVRQFAMLLGKCGFAPPTPVDEHECRWSLDVAFGVGWLPFGAQSPAATAVEMVKEVAVRGEVGMRIDWPVALETAVMPPQVRQPVRACVWHGVSASTGSRGRRLVPLAVLPSVNSPS